MSAASSLDYTALFEAFREDQPIYERLAPALEAKLREVVQSIGSKALVTARPKELPSLLRKAWQDKYDDPLTQIRDRAGGRVIVSFEYEVPAVVEALKAAFEVVHDEDKAEKRAPDQLAYIGYHLEVRLRAGDLGDDEAVGRICEIQVHTRAQSAWADVTHDLLYKSALEPDPDVRRSLMRLIALVEIFDVEAGRAREAIMATTGYEEAVLVAALESAFIRLTGTPSDHQFSLIIVPFLRRLYDSGEDVAALIESFVAARSTKLTELYARYRADYRADPLVHQPESLIVFERLDSNRFEAQTRWPEELDEGTLDRLAVVWGSPLD